MRFFSRHENKKSKTFVDVRVPVWGGEKNKLKYCNGLNLFLTNHVPEWHPKISTNYMFCGVTWNVQQILPLHTQVSNTHTCLSLSLSHTPTHTQRHTETRTHANQAQRPATPLSVASNQPEQRQRRHHSFRTKLLRRKRGLVARVLPFEMQTLWYGNWQLQKPARIHTSMHWNHLRNVRWDGTSFPETTQTNGPNQHVSGRLRDGSER